MLHAAALVVVLAWHVTASTIPVPDGPPMPFFIAPRPELPTPPPAKPVVTTPTPRSIVPTTAPDGFKPEVTPPPASPGIPGIEGLPVGPGVQGLLSSGPRIDAVIQPPPPRAPSVVTVGGAIKAPTRVVYVAPTYPSIAQISHIEGEVLLEATIDETGVVRNVVVKRSVPLLDRAAIEAVSKWRYSPTLLNGRPVSVIMQVGVKFTLR